jgi:hypothetical protein
MQEHEDVDDFMWVLQLTDDKVMPTLLPPPPPLTDVSGNTATMGAGWRLSAGATNMIYS